MKTVIALSVLFISTASVTPSLANYFHNPYTNVNRNIGSVPSPTPRDIRENRMPEVGHTAPSAADPSAKTVAADPAPSRRVASK